MSRRVRWGGAAALAVLIAATAGAVAVRVRGRSDPDRLFQQARAELVVGHPDRAGEAVDRLGKVRAPTPFDRLLRAQVDEALGRPDEALAELAGIADGHPLAPVARLQAGQIAMRRGRLRAAESAFLATVALDPKTPLPRRELVYLYNLQHRQADLDAQLHALSELGPLEFAYLLHWAETRNVVWNPERDCERLAACVEADPDDRRSRLALAEGLRQMSRLDEADAILAPLPDSDSRARALRAMVALDRGDHAEFDRLIAGAADDDPDLARIRGQVALKRNDGPAAVRYFRIAHRADPADRVVLFGLGNALRLSGDPKGAEPYLAASLRHDALTPLITRAATDEGAADPALPARLGAACEAAGRLLEARAWYKLAIARDPLDRAAQQAIFRLGRRIDGPDPARGPAG